jgi:hypothetical protein
MRSPFATRNLVALETAINLALREKLERSERAAVRGDRRAAWAAYWCCCRLAERYAAGLGLGFYYDAKER